MGSLSKIGHGRIETSECRREQTTPCRRRSHFCLVPINKCLFSPAPSDQRRGTEITTANGRMVRRGTEITTANGRMVRRCTEITTANGRMVRRGTEIATANGRMVRRGTEIATANGRMFVGVRRSQPRTVGMFVRIGGE